MVGAPLSTTRSGFAPADAYFKVYKEHPTPPAPLKLARFRRKSRQTPERDLPASAPPVQTRFEDREKLSGRPSTADNAANPSNCLLSKQTADKIIPAAVSVLHIEVPSNAGFGFGEPTLPISSVLRGDVSTDTMDQLVETLRPRSRAPSAGTSSRRGRSRVRETGRSRRHESQRLEQHQRELRSRLETLAAEPPASPRPPSLQTPVDSDVEPLSPVSRRSSNLSELTSYVSPILAKSETFMALGKVSDYSGENDMMPPTPPTVKPKIAPLPDTLSLSDQRIKSIDEIIGSRSGPSQLIRLATADSASHKADINHIPTIEELVAAHAPILKQGSPSRSQRASRVTPSPSASGSSAQRTLGFAETGEVFVGNRSSLDSLSDEVNRPLLVPLAPQALHHARSLPNITRKDAVQLTVSIGGNAVDQALGVPLRSLATHARLTASTPRTEKQLAEYLKSPRLTRLMLLKRAPNAGLTVSLADVGAADGHPVVVFLGLGCVRYLVALYDELAEAYGLRLVCLDRWGLGKTGNVPDTKRGFLEWSSVVEEVIDELRIKRFSVLAHSAGAPYALATSLRLSQRLCGSIHLLAPWVATGESADAAAAFKWLRWVPTPVIRTAQAAEWRIQAWKLGKPPTLPVESGIGYDPRAPISSEGLGPESPSPDDAFLEDGWDAVETGSQVSYSTGTITPGGGAGTPRQRFKRLFQRSASTPHTATATLPSPQMASPTPLLSTQGASPFSPSQAPSVFSAPSRFMPSLLRSRGSSSIAGTAVSLDSSPAIDLGTALLAASHAESLKGSTADLMAILERTNKPMGFSYSSVVRRIVIWHGDKDDRIPLASVRSLERSMPNAELRVVEGANHDLMQNVKVIVEALESIQRQASGPPSPKTRL